MKRIGWLLWKDAVAEARGLERLATLGVFGIAVLLTFHFTLPADSDARPLAAPGFLWATLIFAGLLELRRSFEAERADGTLDGIRASPLDPTGLLLAKIGSGFVVLGVLTAALVPLTTLFFGGRTRGIPAAIGVALLGIVGLLAWGTLFAAVAGSSRSGELVLPVILFPLLVPQTIACVRLLAHHMAGSPLESAATGYLLLVASAVLAFGTSILLFDYVLEE